VTDPENFMALEREEARAPLWGAARSHLQAARDELAPGADRLTRQELRREGRELEEDLAARRGPRR
jgi:hypothetical protein